jgi:hypothetical protein
MPLRLNPVTGELFIQGVDYVDFDRPPTAADNVYEPPFGWLDTSLDEWYICVALSATGVATWKAAGGDVSGPASSTDEAIARFDGTTGKLLQNSVAILDDVGVLTGLTQLDVDNLRLDGNTISSTDAAGDVILAPDTTGGAVVTTNLTVGNATQDVAFTVNGASITGVVSVEGTDVTDLGGIISHRHSATAAFGGHFVNLRSRGTHATPTVVADNDLLSLYAVAGFDGTDYALAATISGEVDGTPGADDMPGRLVFLTSADGGQTPIEAMRIDSSQLITLANALTVPNGGSGFATATDGGIVLGSGTNPFTVLAQATDGQIPIGSTGADPVLNTISAGTGITVTNTAGDIQIDSTGGGVTWNVVTGATQALVASNGYIGNRGTAITYTLPDTAIVGTEIKITNIGAGLPVLAQNAGESVHFTASTTTVGVGGSLTAIDQFSSLELVCVVADTEWNVLSSTGNWTIV